MHVFIHSYSLKLCKIKMMANLKRMGCVCQYFLQTFEDHDIALKNKIKT